MGVYNGKRGLNLILIEVEPIYMYMYVKMWIYVTEVYSVCYKLNELYTLLSVFAAKLMTAL